MKKTLLTYGLSAALLSILLLTACVGSNETEPAATAGPLPLWNPPRPEGLPDRDTLSDAVPRI